MLGARSSRALVLLWRRLERRRRVLPASNLVLAARARLFRTPRMLGTSVAGVPSRFALDLALLLADRERPILQCVPLVGFDERSVGFPRLSFRLLLSIRAHGSFLQRSRQRFPSVSNPPLCVRCLTCGLGDEAKFPA
jgi:hypothetical protein